MTARLWHPSGMRSSGFMTGGAPAATTGYLLESLRDESQQVDFPNLFWSCSKHVPQWSLKRGHSFGHYFRS